MKTTSSRQRRRRKGRGSNDGGGGAMESSEVRTKPTISLIRIFLLHLPACHVVAVCRTGREISEILHQNGELLAMLPILQLLVTFFEENASARSDCGSGVVRPCGPLPLGAYVPRKP